MSDSIVPHSAPGFEHVAQFGTVEQEYAAIRDGAALIDRSARTRMHFAGAKPAETLAGLVTCEGRRRAGIRLHLRHVQRPQCHQD